MPDVGRRPLPALIFSQGKMAQSLRETLSGVRKSGLPEFAQKLCENKCLLLVADDKRPLQESKQAFLGEAGNVCLEKQLESLSANYNCNVASAVTQAFGEPGSRRTSEYGAMKFARVEASR